MSETKCFICGNIHGARCWGTIGYTAAWIVVLLAIIYGVLRLHVAITEHVAGNVVDEKCSARRTSER